MDSAKTNLDLQKLLGNFSVDQSTYTFNRIDQGFINDTYLVLKNGHPFYILQRINSEVFTDVPGVMANITKALSYLTDTDYSLVALVPTITGQSYCEYNNSGYWRLMEYIPNSLAYDSAKNAEIAFGAGKILGKFHSLLQNAPSAQFVDTIPHFHDMPLRKVKFLEALSKSSHERRVKANLVIPFVLETLPLLLDLSSSTLPVRICHNDTKLNNILFSRKTNQALCFIDLDTIMKGYFYNDFGDLVRTIANTAKEDEKDHHKITFDRPLFESFLDGLATSSAFLTAEELKSLPLGIVFMPFIHGLRALTDYLNNDKYYKVSYADQNLDRSLSLFDFSKKALSEVSYVQKMVAKKLIR